MFKLMKRWFYSFKAYHDNFLNPGSLGLIIPTFLSFVLTTSFPFLLAGLIPYSILSLYLLAEDRKNMKRLVNCAKFRFSRKEYSNVWECICANKPYTLAEEDLEGKYHFNDERIFIESKDFQNALKENYGEYYGKKIVDYLRASFA